MRRLHKKIPFVLLAKPVDAIALTGITLTSSTPEPDCFAARCLLLSANCRLFSVYSEKYEANSWWFVQIKVYGLMPRTLKKLHDMGSQ